MVNFFFFLGGGGVHKKYTGQKKCSFVDSAENNKSGNLATIFQRPSTLVLTKKIFGERSVFIFTYILFQQFFVLFPVRAPIFVLLIFSRAHSKALYFSLKNKF